MAMQGCRLQLGQLTCMREVRHLAANSDFDAHKDDHSHTCVRDGVFPTLYATLTSQLSQGFFGCFCRFLVSELLSVLDLKAHNPNILRVCHSCIDLSDPSGVSMLHRGLAPAPVVADRCLGKAPLANLVCHRQRRLHPAAATGLAEVAASVQSVVEQIAAVAPGPLQPVVNVIGGDVASVVGGVPTAAGIGRLLVRG